jgi:hypothetical protein
MEDPYQFLTSKDIEQIKLRGMTPEGVALQLEKLRRGVSFRRLMKPATLGDGIRVLAEDEVERLCALYEKALSQRVVAKFVPASGAATRMFEGLSSLLRRMEDGMGNNAELGEEELATIARLREGLTRFAFCSDLSNVMKRDGLDLNDSIRQGDWVTVLRYILTPKGLNYLSLPKGLIKFHSYGGCARSAFEEHLAEALGYVRDARGVTRVHFTVAKEHALAVEKHLVEVKSKHERGGARFDITLSLQKPSTDTVVVDLDGSPIRDSSGRLQFRPGGHGALIENLAELDGDIVFIKNIDNVVPDRLKPTVFRYKKALGGCLLELEDKILRQVRALSVDPETEATQAVDFIKDELGLPIPEWVWNMDSRGMARYALGVLNRPLRVCGVVRNAGEPGGGPFWVMGEDGAISLQIVEASEVDASDESQREIWASATHFNPVDIVCSLRDAWGNPFDLTRYVDDSAYFISVKYSGGRMIRALELPGLWNGAMASWNTVFVEVPIATFSPVKTVFDLLRAEHLVAK